MKIKRALKGESVNEEYNLRNLKIDYDLFRRYFTTEFSFFNKFQEDIAVDDNSKEITIRDCRIIPVLGMLKMLDDYNSKSISEGWKLSTYSTFKEAYG
jgi:hypothetical protein